MPSERLNQVFQIVVQGTHKVIAPGASQVAQQIINLSAGDLAGLLAEMARLGIDAEDLRELESAIAEDASYRPPRGLGSKVATWLGKRTAEIATGALHLVTSAGSQIGVEVVVKMLLRYYGLNQP